jgi:peptide/nickel transport system substrate-binding protein
MNSFFSSLFIKERNLKSADNLNKIVGGLNSIEKLIFTGLAFVLVVSGVALALKASAAFTEEIPTTGGTLNEGMVGSPRFINPILAVSDTDKAIASLVYSGLLKARSNNDSFVPDLAESYEISPDGLVYTVKMRDDISFHDGKPLTIDDIIFTIEKTLDPVIKSPKRANWEGVQVDKLDELTLQFTLKKPYAPFIENLTLGIIPKHIWQYAEAEEFPFSQWNIEPVGSGPYKISRVKRNGSGIPTYIELSAFKKHSGGRANISNIVVRFFRDESQMIQGYKSGSIDGASGISPLLAQTLVAEGAKVIHKPMARVFGAFFNQNKAPIFANSEVRMALDLSVDKKQVVNEVLLGFGTPLAGPVPEEVWQDNATSSEARIEEARGILQKAGWKLNEKGIFEKKTKAQTSTLAFSISTGNVPELKKTGEILRDTWTKLGAEVDLKVFESADLNRDVIRTRNYEALLFGENLGQELDLYPFWHSSQRVDPGLNIAIYTNINADKLIEETRATPDKALRTEKSQILYAEISKDVPAVFTYAPEFIYVVNPRINNVQIESGANLSDRFAGIKDWYIETDKVWKIFVKK